jgi:D-isomer specific 2-hydroxyacid dehydrogenase, NAD binding domain
VVLQDVRENPELLELGMEYMSVDELVATSDVISLHVPLLPATAHLIDAERFAPRVTSVGNLVGRRMQRTSYPCEKLSSMA